MKNGQGEKVVKLKVVQELAVMVGWWQKFYLIITIQVNLVPIPSETWRRLHKFTWTVAIKILNLPSQPILSRHLQFHNFSPCPFFIDDMVEYALCMCVCFLAGGSGGRVGRWWGGEGWDLVMGKTTEKLCVLF